MARRGQFVSSLVGGCVMVVGWSLLLQSFLLVEVIGTELKDGKAYYSPPGPRSRSPPSGSRGRGSTPRVTSPTTARSCGSPPRGQDPSRSTRPPSGGYYRSPPTSGGTPSTPVTTPVDPRTPSTPTTTSPPSGGYYPSPTSGGDSPPTTVTSTPPATPIDPGTPSFPSITAPPFGFPTAPPFGFPPFGFPPIINPFIRPYNYYLSNPGVIIGLVGFVMPMGPAFRVTTPVPGFPAAQNLIQALGNTSADGLGALYREGTAALLNSIASNRFPFTTAQVRQSFVSALSSNEAASAQARLFKLANEGRLKPRAN
ncbi:protodermal factor 1 [Eucalyptus grandis]|uniref:Uncharacterized protein n=2 Tax=Eucalyptus grandis TaxID=71139 RepID=A0ACC3M4Z8_EUCGR|nr:protodermal factor 1 [Eucalyptus grandis]KAK3446228.1 hypothetical protein EUGRSUZ_A01963 [Eucalyptus grandis]